MGGNVDKTVWRRGGLILILLPICFFFPFTLILVGFLAWTIYEDFKPSSRLEVPPRPTWRDARPEDANWLDLFCEGCESPAEEAFLRAVVKEFDLQPQSGTLISPKLTLEMQVEIASYRFDFLANGRQVIEIDGAAYHSSPDQMERDRVRDEYCVERGYKVLRIPASTVFNMPDEVVQRVKAILAETPVYTRPRPTKFVSRKGTIAQNVAAFSETLAELNRSKDATDQQQRSMAGFKSAISREEILLGALVRSAESDQRIEAMSPEQRKIYNELLDHVADIAEAHEDFAGGCGWEKIIKPAPVEDLEVQRQIEAEYEIAIAARDERLRKVRERCTKDPVFRQFLCRRMIEAGYPEEERVKLMTKIETAASLDSEGRIGTSV